MHPRNRHQNRYDLKRLAETSPGLGPYLLINKYGDESIDFSNSEAVKQLNKAILKSSYDIQYWDIPNDFLCPPIPGRADYIHSASDLFESQKNLKVLDIGTGANCIYPLIGHKEYHWNFVGSDISPGALANAQTIIDRNHLSQKIELRLQKDPLRIFENIILAGEYFDLTICNPPFHESQAEALKGTERKWKNLGKDISRKALNFGGKGAELWCPGGEKTFIHEMIIESQKFKSQVRFFTTLVSKEDNLTFLTKTLKKLPVSTKIIDMHQGQKKSRILTWTYL
jgi:23S rRNA (adenine1618-N6)-methyltransferase